MKSSKNTLKNMAALIWIIGGIILFFKGFSLLKQAQFISPSILIVSGIVVISLIIGLVKGKFVMAKFCRKNLTRINNIDNPKIYQFFDLRFFIFLSLMILLGITLSKLAVGNYLFLLAVGCLDLSLSTALLTSSIIFFKK